MATTFYLRAQPSTKEMPKTIRTYGWSGLGVLDVSNVLSYSKSSVDTISVIESYGNLFASFYTMSFSWRKNFVEFNDHLSISLETSPYLNIGGFRNNDGWALFAFEIPLMIGVNWGTAATFKSINFKGGSINAGLSFVRAPLLQTNVNDLNFFENEIRFCSSFKFRNWTYRKSEEGRAREFELYFSVANAIFPKP